MIPIKTRERLLVDRFVNDVIDPDIQPMPRETIERLRLAARKAHRFVFDDAAMVRVGEIARDIPELIIREHQFARAPYDLSWVEFHLSPLWETIMGERSAEDSDDRVAYLFDHGTAYTISGGHLNGERHADMAVMPYAYDLHTPWSMPDQLAVSQIVGTSRLTLAAHFWGNSFGKLSHEDQTALRNANTLRLLPVAKRFQAQQENIYRQLFAPTVGELRNIVLLLLMLNRPQITRYEMVGQTRGFVRGKLKPYLSHTLVRIDTDPKPVLLKIGTPAGEGVPRRLHEVRGHWRHDQTYHAATRTGCIHTWAPQPEHDDDLHWQCSVCTGKRWWVSQHERGSSLEGVVLKDGYEVRPGGGA